MAPKRRVRALCMVWPMPPKTTESSSRKPTASCMPPVSSFLIESTVSSCAGMQGLRGGQGRESTVWLDNSTMPLRPTVTGCHP